MVSSYLDKVLRNEENARRAIANGRLAEHNRLNFTHVDQTLAFQGGLVLAEDTGPRIMVRCTVP